MQTFCGMENGLFLAQYFVDVREGWIIGGDEWYSVRFLELERYLTKREYKNNFVKSQISRAKSIPRNDTLKENSPEIKKPDRVPFTYPISKMSPYQPMHARWLARIKRKGLFSLSNTAGYQTSMNKTGFKNVPFLEFL